MVGDKALTAHIFQQRIVHHLDGPDEPDKGPRDREMNHK